MTKQTLTLDDFWASIEDAWATVPDATEARATLSNPAVPARERTKAAVALGRHMDAMLAALRLTLGDYTSARLSAWDGYCERMLYNIDREEVHEVLDGSDDGFLYTRGFVVAAGKLYYDLVDKTPSLGVSDAEAEAMCYLAAELHNERFGEWPAQTGISRETASNPDGWQ